MLSPGGGSCHALLGLVADGNDDNLNMKERAGNCEHRKLYHDRPLCALPQQTGSHWQGWMPGWQYLALTVDPVVAETVIPHMLVQDHAIQETDASRSGLNYASATGDSIPNLWKQKLPLLTQEGSLRAMTFQAAQRTVCLTIVGMASPVLGSVMVGQTGTIKRGCAHACRALAGGCQPVLVDWPG